MKWLIYCFQRREGSSVSQQRMMVGDWDHGLLSCCSDPVVCESTKQYISHQTLNHISTKLFDVLAFINCMQVRGEWKVGRNSFGQNFSWATILLIFSTTRTSFLSRVQPMQSQKLASFWVRCSATSICDGIFILNFWYLDIRSTHWPSWTLIGQHVTFLWPESAIHRITRLIFLHRLASMTWS